MAVISVAKIDGVVQVYRDEETGLAWAQIPGCKVIYTSHPHLYAYVPVNRVIESQYWEADDEVVVCNGYKFNIDRCFVYSKYDHEANKHCKCGGVHGGRGTRDFRSGGYVKRS